MNDSVARGGGRRTGEESLLFHPAARLRRGWSMTPAVANRGRSRSGVLAACLRLALIAGVAVAVPVPVAAHAGPPFPIIVDERVGPWQVSVWTDPDIGIGEFWVVLEPAGEPPAPGATRVRVGIRPVSGRLDEVVYDAVPQRVRRGERHYTEVAFDQGEWWDVRIIVEYPGGRGELPAVVEATPDGMIGPIGMIFYLLPFLAIAFIWLRVALRKRELRRAP